MATKYVRAHEIKIKSQNRKFVDIYSMERKEALGRLICYMALTVILCMIVGASFANMSETGYPTERAVWGTNLTIAVIGLVLLNLKNT